MYTFLQVAAVQYGEDIMILGLPVAAVIAMFVQFLKMLSMPREWAPYASLALGYLLAAAVEWLKYVPFSRVLIVEWIMLGASFALMASGLFSVITKTEAVTRARASKTSAKRLASVLSIRDKEGENIDKSAAG